MIEQKSYQQELGENTGEVNQPQGVGGLGRESVTDPTNGNVCYRSKHSDLILGQNYLMSKGQSYKVQTTNQSIH